MNDGGKKERKIHVQVERFFTRRRDQKQLFTRFPSFKPTTSRHTVYLLYITRTIVCIHVTNTDTKTEMRLSTIFHVFVQTTLFFIFPHTYLSSTYPILYVFLPPPSQLVFSRYLMYFLIYILYSVLQFSWRKNIDTCR